MFDTHAHLEMLQDGVKDILTRARTAGVTRILTVGTTDAANAFAVKAAQDFQSSIFAAIGYDRDQAAPDNDLDGMTASLRRLIEEKKQNIAAIGETGLDFHYKRETAESQTALFETQLALAAKCNLPVIVHSREAEAETMACLDRHPNARGVIHCFTGSMDLARRALERGFMISFSGILTFRNANDIRDVAKEVPENMILVETDSPYLAPEPHRGKKNEPALLPETLRCLAEIRNKLPEEMANITDCNALRLFGIA